MQPHTNGTDGSDPTSIDPFDFAFKIQSSSEYPDQIFVTVLTYDYDPYYGGGCYLLGKTYPFFN